MSGGRDATGDRVRRSRARHVRPADVLGGANDPVVGIDSKLIVTLFNKGATRLFGYAPREVIGRPFDMLVPEAKAASYREQIGQFIASPSTSRSTARRTPAWCRHKDGGEFPVEASVLKLDLAGRGGVTVFLHDATARHHLEHQIARTNSILSTQLETAPDGILLVDENARVISCNRKYLEIWGVPEELVAAQQDDPVLQAAVAEVEDSEAYVARVRQIYENRTERSREEIRARDGRIIDRFTAPVISAQGEYYGRVWYFRDVTQTRRAAVSLQRANRALIVNSAVNEALLRGESEAWLLDMCCRVLIDPGGYRMAWIGFIEYDEAQSLRPVAQRGVEDGYLERAAVSWGDNERGRGPAGTVARTGSLQIVREVAADARMAAWREDALQRGYASVISLPLVSEQTVLGVLSIYSSEADAFDEEEVRLLQKLADNLAFGVATHRSELARRRAAEKAERLAFFDPLTNLPNRVQLMAHVGLAVKSARIRSQPLALMSISVDRFHEVQDGVGIGGADQLLRDVAARLAKVAGDGNFIARIGGEMFAIVIAQADLERVHDIAIRIQLAMSEPLEIAGIPIDVQTTNGVALFPEHGDDADALVRRADIAIREARAAGTDYALYSGTVETESPQRLTLLAELRRAIRNDELVLHYQPKIDVKSGCVSGVEALVRWPHPQRGIVAPGDFIPLAERTGLIKPITRWVLEEAMRQIVRWRQVGLRVPVAVNVSPNNLRDPGFLGQLVELNAPSGARLDLLQVEITETALMEDPERSREALARIRELGIEVHIDDFGTGYSSLSYIATLPINGLKIDRSFVLGMMQQARHRAVVSASISLAHSLGLRVIAEGIETAEQARALVQLGCNEIQGYLFSRPLPPDEFLRWHAQFDWRAATPILPAAERKCAAAPDEMPARAG